MVAIPEKLKGSRLSLKRIGKNIPERLIHEMMDGRTVY